MQSNGHSLRVVLADDHAVVRAGLRLLLDREEGIMPVAEASTTAETVECVKKLRPDVALVDVTMPDGNGIDIIPRLLESSPETKVVVLTMHDDPWYVHHAFAAGARGYVVKEAADAELVAAIRDVAAGETYLSPTLGARVVADERRQRAEAEADPLSPREHEVLRLLALGNTNQEIAQQLSISVRTAETHRAHIMRKLDLGSRAELVRYALERDLLSTAV
jgi:two-component system, NarL family, response regulator NreC